MPNDNKQNLSNSTDNQTPVNNNQAVTTVTDDMPPVVMEDTTPPMLNTTDLPIANTQTQTTPVVEEKKEESSETDSGSAAPNNDVVMAPVVTTQKKKFAGGRVIATILGLFLLVGGLGAGTYLVQQNQDIREKAGACGGGCGPNMVCGGLVNGVAVCEPKSGNGPAIPVSQVEEQGESWNEWQEEEQGITNTGSNCPYNGNPTLSYLCTVGVAQLDGQPQLPTGATRQQRADGTWIVLNASGVQIAEYRITGSGGGGGTPPGDSITAQCQNVKAYSSTWTLLTNAQLAQLKTGDSVNFCVAGSATGGSFNKARFTINGALQAETTTVRPSSTDFCQTYVIPAATKTFNVSAEINHVTLGWK